jgi:hypothetical protein
VVILRRTPFSLIKTIKKHFLSDVFNDKIYLIHEVILKNLLLRAEPVSNFLLLLLRQPKSHYPNYMDDTQSLYRPTYDEFSPFPLDPS